MRDEDENELKITYGNTSSVKIDQKQLDEMKKAMEKFERYQWDPSTTGGYVPNQTTNIPNTFIDTENQRIRILEARVNMLQEQMEEMTKVLKFFKMFLPDDKE